MFHSANLRAFSRPRGVRSLGLPLASTAAVIALTSFTAPAKVLSFNWQFSNTQGAPVFNGGVVTGTVSGLLDNTSNQTTGLTVTVTSTPNTPTGGWLNDWAYNTGDGFSVSNGLITAYNVRFKNSANDDLYLGDNTGINYYPKVADSNYNFDNRNYSFANPVTFTPQGAAVPGPLPILGAASALGWSRRVRSRLRNVKGSVR